MAQASAAGWTRSGALFGRSNRQKPSVRPQTKKSSDDEVVEAKKPDAAELRLLRTSYYDATPRVRKRVSSTTRSATASHARGRTSSNPPTGEAVRHRRRRKSGVTGTEGSREGKRKSYRHRRTEDFVYGTSPTQVYNREPNTEASASTIQRRPVRPSGSSLESDFPVTAGDDITPDDSVSQIGRRKTSKQKAQPSTPRPSLARHNTTPAKTTPNIESSVRSVKDPSVSSRKLSGPSSIFGSLLRSKTASTVPTQSQKVECLTCGSDDIRITRSALLECGHRMCNDCLKRVFEMSVKDPAHMPPKCCTRRHIPLKHVDKLFDQKFKLLWNRRYQEYHTKDRIYCPTAKCGEWIRPVHIQSVQGRKFGKCPRCKTKVCVLCNSKMHKSEECPKDPEIAELVQQAKKEGWQTCYSCKAIVEKKDGCNHMTCRCTAQFCIICGLKWKTCDCAWITPAGIEDGDRLNHMRVPEAIRARARPFGGGIAAVPAPEPMMHGFGNYMVEMEQRRRQEQEDEVLARRLQLANLNEPDDDETPRRRLGVMDTWGIGNAAGHFMNDDFVQNAANVVMGAFGGAVPGRRGAFAAGRRQRPEPEQPADE